MEKKRNPRRRESVQVFKKVKVLHRPWHCSFGAKSYKLPAGGGGNLIMMIFSFSGGIHVEGSDGFPGAR